MRNVIVTGGSRGLGLAIARRLSSTGYRVIAIARKQNPELTTAMQDAEGSNPGSFHFVPFDLAETDNISCLVRQLRKDYGVIYGLVNNAGISFEGLLALMPAHQIEQLVRINVVSPIVLTKHVIRLMMADGGGRIVNLASIAAFTGYSGLSVYGATKASMIGFSRSLAREIGRVGININSVAPGFIETDMTKTLSDDMRQQVERRSALRRLAEGKDVANAVEFLLGDNARNITGTVITVDAGSTA
ncbi:SDR family NAD(P)-dependent oxidoreductase [Acidipila rosea]|uniref:3-oxoacyl-[acyl-carrier protein] reductase n=1 Tax=Acidipila rosea TaxID=768535 RepID=A0A4R1KZY2_9BACT|nr:SDR family oxidoreductase [Acidipila rosea]TCK70257.1 3-oxoacyl-[acyl-carrier protein] reductase [Acidipila rosea]